MTNELSGLSEEQIIERCVSGIDKHDRVTIEAIAAHPTTLRLSRMAMDRELGKIEISADLADKIRDAIRPVAEFVKKSGPSAFHEFYSKDKDPKTHSEILEKAARNIEGHGSKGSLTFTMGVANQQFTGKLNTPDGGEVEMSQGYTIDMHYMLGGNFTAQDAEFTDLSDNEAKSEISYTRNDAIEKLADTCREIIAQSGALKIHHTPIGPSAEEGTRLIGTDIRLDKKLGGRLIARLKREFAAEADAAQHDFRHADVVYTFTEAENTAQPA